MTLPSGDAWTALYSALGVLALLAAFWRWARPRWRAFWSRVEGVLDTLNGRDEFVDPTTGRKVPSVPPLGTRVGRMEETLATVANQQRILENHEQRLSALEDARVEKIVTAAERAATAASATEMLRLAHEKDVLNAEADDEQLPHEPPELD